ncbi:unnamed protein product [Leuciscus chuanchicus]
MQAQKPVGRHKSPGPEKGALLAQMHQGRTQIPLVLSKTVNQSCQEMSWSPSQLHLAPDLLFQKDPVTSLDPEKRVQYSHV